MTDPVEQFGRDWSRDHAVANICVRLFQYLSTRENRLEHFNYSQLKAAARAKDDARLTQALQYLSSPRWRVLHQAFLFFDEDNVYEFDSDEMAQYFREGKFPHPRTGQVIDDLNQIAVAFEPGHFFHGAS